MFARNICPLSRCRLPARRCAAIAAIAEHRDEDKVTAIVC